MGSQRFYAFGTTVLILLKKYLSMPQRYDISFERQIISVILYHYKIIAHSHWLDSKR